MHFILAVALQLLRAFLRVILSMQADIVAIYGTPAPLAWPGGAMASGFAPWCLFASQPDHQLPSQLASRLVDNQEVSKTSVSIPGKGFTSKYFKTF